ncbi:ATP-binding cassette domain-containing protein [Streptomyces kanamyceticus]|uniref:ATP-binding cassette domain-containing protein n=1 Tax=Streptomyces kanamyceticus TaxID=1967 RepID=A0A5J6GTE5_STRKN|nr:ATP-binding cassette domain-containing protein [Streptomyces kanamyceticus]QEU96286.1 ATP-binding cassette domain-containing protein [Streptomyces kanamyceticus]
MVTIGEQPGVELSARGVELVLPGGGVALSGIDVPTVAPGRVLGIAGGSGAGKTLLLEVLAGLRAPRHGQVSVRAATGDAGHVPRYGFVPQDDIVHRALPLRVALEYAARLRGTDPGDVPRVLDELGLGDVAGQPVRTLSGGQRKRASIAIELLSRPRLLFLDEPTSGLDPPAGARLTRYLVRLAASGVTVVFTTHTPADLHHCDQVMFIAPNGRPGPSGTPAELLDLSPDGTFEALYSMEVPQGGEQSRGRAPRASTEPPLPSTPARFSPATGRLRQWAVLTGRDLRLLRHDRLTAAITVGSPLIIITMFALLFRPGVFDPARPSPAASAMVLFWIAFGAFFFGLAYGLPQICGELAVVRRERRTVLRLWPYLLAKLTVLGPVLLLADALLLVVLRALDRLPAAAMSVHASLFATTALASFAALALGLCCSALVSEPSQAALVLPLLCFPQVLFSGAFVPVPGMAAGGRWISVAMTNRWAFEALGSGAGLETLWRGGGAAGRTLLDSYGNSFGHPAWVGWLILAGCAVALLTAAWLVLRRRCPTSAHRLSTSDAGPVRP